MDHISHTLDITLKDSILKSESIELKDQISRSSIEKYIQNIPDLSIYDNIEIDEYYHKDIKYKTDLFVEYKYKIINYKIDDVKIDRNYDGIDKFELGKRRYHSDNPDNFIELQLDIKVYDANNHDVIKELQKNIKCNLNYLVYNYLEELYITANVINMMIGK